jgi:hypothetical protein
MEKGATRVATVATRASESLSFDAALGGRHAAIAWDDDGVDGGIEVALAALDGSGATKPVLVSAPKSDPEAPQVEPRVGAGFWVAWIERRPEGDAPEAGAEGPAEDRTFAWVTVGAVDATGAVVVSPHRLTSMTGHTGAFAMAARPTGELDVFVRDDTQEKEGGGGKIAHVVVHGDPVTSTDPVVVATGVGRGSVDVVGVFGRGEWLAFTDVGDRAVVAPLGDGRTLAGPASVEESLEGARLLGLGAPAELLGAFPGDGIHLRRVSCDR